MDIFLNQLIQFYSNNSTNLHHLTTHRANTMSLGMRPTSLSSGILIQATTDMGRKLGDFMNSPEHEAHNQMHCINTFYYH